MPPPTPIDQEFALIMTRKPLLSALIPLALAIVALPAAAAGMNCAQARTPTELAICADPELHRQDAELSDVYRDLGAARPDEREALRQAQRDWLKARNACGGNADCIRLQYASRLNALQTQWRRATAYTPDDTDRQALEDLRQAVQAASADDAEFPLEKVLASLSVKTGVTTFANVRQHEDDDDARFPSNRPDGVSQEEWTALVTAGVDAGGENGSASYTLMDLDGDGQRDLIIDSYTGGTGLFSDISAMRRDGLRFVASPTGLYSLNGRGANQAGDWIRLRDRVYAAYRVSQYGVDRVYLLRPFYSVGDAPTLTVRYRYALSVPRQQKQEDKGAETTLDDGLHAALNRALDQIDPETARDPQAAGDPARPLCPIPADTQDDARGSYYSYGAGHYTIEVVGDMRVQLGPRCYIGRMIDWFGGYDAKQGLYALLLTRPPEGEGREAEYTVLGKRRAIKIDAGVGPVVGDNGA